MFPQAGAFGIAIFISGLQHQMVKLLNGVALLRMMMHVLHTCLHSGRLAILHDSIAHCIIVRHLRHSATRQTTAYMAY